MLADPGVYIIRLRHCRFKENPSVNYHHYGPIQNKHVDFCKSDTDHSCRFSPLQNSLHADEWHLTSREKAPNALSQALFVEPQNAVSGPVTSRNGGEKNPVKTTILKAIYEGCNSRLYLQLVVLFFGHILRRVRLPTWGT